MTDAVAVFSPGYRLTDNTTGAVVGSGTLEFFDAGTSTPKTVYADENLTTALGTSVQCDSLGYPTSNGTTKTLVYVGPASYKVVAKDGDGVTLWTHDNVKGAVETTSSGGGASVTAEFPVVTKSLDYTVVDADQNTVFAVNCSSGDVKLTLPSAVTMGSGWAIRVQHAGSANQALVETVSSQTITEGSKSFGTMFALALNGEDLMLVSDGGNWRVVNHTTPFIKLAQGVLPITDRLTAPPGSEVQGSLYLISGSPSGAWSSFAQHDIAQYTGAGWVQFTPYTDCGWLAYVADEDTYYRFMGSAWVSDAASDTVKGFLEIAVQSEMETGTDVVRAVVPGRQQFHAGHPKCWGKATVSGGTPTLQTSYNMTSITDDAVGYLTWTIATDFSSANWAALGLAQMVDGSNDRLCQLAFQAAGSLQLNSITSGGSDADPLAYHLVGLGDQ